MKHMKKFLALIFTAIIFLTGCDFFTKEEPRLTNEQLNSMESGDKIYLSETNCDSFVYVVNPSLEASESDGMYDGIAVNFVVMGFEGLSFFNVMIEFSISAVVLSNYGDYVPFKANISVSLDNNGDGVYSGLLKFREPGRHVKDISLKEAGATGFVVKK